MILIMVEILKNTYTSDENTKKSLRFREANVVLVGCTGAGKSTVGFYLAKYLGFGLFDLDAAIEKNPVSQLGKFFSLMVLPAFAS